MKDASVKSWQALIPVFFLLTFLVPLKSGFSTPVAVEATCPAPNVTITDKDSGFVSFAWDAVSGASAYKVYYYRSEDNYTSSEFTTGSTSFSFSSLPAGTYDFYFATNCGGVTSGYIVVEDILMV